MKLNFLIVLLCVSITACAMGRQSYHITPQSNSDECYLRENQEANIVMFGNEMIFTVEDNN